jgi:hypothetical protein
MTSLSKIDKINESVNFDYNRFKKIVSGKVVEKESGYGVACLLVEAFYFDSSIKLANLRSVNNLNRGYRFGSSITDINGGFHIEGVPPNLKRHVDGQGLNLVVLVSAPEEPSSDKKLLYFPQDFRTNPAMVESYLIKIPKSDLEKAGVTLPGISETEVEPIETVSERLIKSAERDVQIVNAKRAALKVKVNSVRNDADKFRKDFLPQIEKSLSSVSQEQLLSDNFVPNGKSVKAINENVMKSDLKSIINNTENRAPVNTRLSLTREQAELVKSSLDNEGKISKKKLNNIIMKNGSKPTKPYYVRTDPILQLCRALSKDEEECANILSDDSQPPPEPSGIHPTNITGNGVESIESSDIPRYLARLTDTITSPEEGLLTGLEPRATKESVSSNIQNLALKPSPADVPAVYHFHSLQVAFRDVWQEAIDEGILSIAEEAYDEIVLLGGEPKLNTSKNPLFALRAEFSAVNKILRQSNITVPEGISAKQQIGTGSFFHPLRGNLGGLFNPSLPDTNWHPPIVSDLLAELDQRMQEPYSFTTFAANKTERSINFGCLVTYEEVLTPVSYQPGKLAKAITLAPNEVQKYTKTVKRHRKRVVKEIEKHIQIRKDELSRVSRIEEEMIRKATSKTNFQLSAEGTAKDPTGSMESTTKRSFERDASTASDSVKRSFQESLSKVSRDITDEFVTDVTTEEGEDFELSESGEISNRSNITAVTFLFYELQRRYKSTQQIHKLTPIVLVAQEMPKPHEINESWLVTHDWILRRVMLDDAFLPALNYLSNSIVGDKIALREMSLNIEQQRQVTRELKTQLGVVRSRIATLRHALEQSLLRSAEKKQGGGGGLFSGIPLVGDVIDLAEDALEGLGDFIFPDTPDVGNSRLDSIKDAIQRTADEERDLLMRLEREVTALNALTETYSKALAENYNQRTQILRLRTHIKQNILYYMQAIWNHEPPDQRYLRLHEVPVPTFEPNISYKFHDFQPLQGAMHNLIHSNFDLSTLENSQLYEAEVIPNLLPIKTKPLAKVADLDNLLGYFGNYMMFALKESNALTDFMMEPYVVQGFDEITDPDELGNWTLDQFIKYVLCLKEKLPPSRFQKIRPELAEQYEKLIKATWRNGEDIIIPTGSLFIEALPATETVEDRFTTIHRVLDLKMAQAKDRHEELENIRLVDRLLHNEREDPEIEKKVIIEGTSNEHDIDVEDSN